MERGSHDKTMIEEHFLRECNAAGLTAWETAKLMKDIDFTLQQKDARYGRYRRWQKRWEIFWPLAILLIGLIGIVQKLFLG